MKMKKLLFTCAAVAGVSLAVSASAFADVAIENVKTTTDTTTASVATLPESSGQMTVIVVKLAAPAEGATSIATPTSISDDDIIYIDQDAYAAGMFQDMGLKDTLSVGDYYMVRVGGENIAESGITEEVYKVVSEVTTPDYPLGDADLSGGLSSNDALVILEAVAGNSDLTGDAFDCADADKSGGLSSNDALAVLEAVAGNSTLEW